MILSLIMRLLAQKFAQVTLGMRKVIEVVGNQPLIQKMDIRATNSLSKWNPALAEGSSKLRQKNLLKFQLKENK